MLNHHVPNLAVDPHSIEEAENIVESFHMQVCCVPFALHHASYGLAIRLHFAPLLNGVVPESG